MKSVSYLRGYRVRGQNQWCGDKTFFRGTLIFYKNIESIWPAFGDTGACPTKRMRAGASCRGGGGNHPLFQE